MEYQESPPFHLLIQWLKINHSIQWLNFDHSTSLVNSSSPNESNPLIPMQFDSIQQLDLFESNSMSLIRITLNPMSGFIRV